MLYRGVSGVLREKKDRMAVLIRIYGVGVQPYRAVAGSERDVEADRPYICGYDQYIILFCKE